MRSLTRATVKLRSGPQYAAAMALRRSALKALAIALLACAAGACGSSSSSSSTTSRPTTSPAHSKHRPRALGARIGETQAVRAAGTTLSVTVSRVVDPLTNSGAALQPGTRAVGVLLRVDNHGPGIYDSSATGDVSLSASSGTSTPLFVPNGVCQTPLRDFDNYISPGELRTGCVAFAVASGARVLTVRFSPHGQAAGRVTWHKRG